ncbi:MAG: addiction module protein [Phycisphaerae bacterium]|nr:addiction module protein [Saprospiraceae bacterium]
MTIDVLKIEALKLERIQRLDFISFLLESIAREEREQGEVSFLSDEQQQEIERRRKDIKSGNVIAIHFADVEAKIRARHGF